MVELEEGGFWEHLMAYTGGNKAETGELSGEVVGNLSTLSCVLEVRVFFFFLPCMRNRVKTHKRK